MSRCEDLRSVKLDQIEDNYLKEIALKGDLVDASYAFKEYRGDRNGKLKDFNIRIYTDSGKLITLIVTRDGRFRLYRAGTELAWEDIEELNDIVAKAR